MHAHPRVVVMLLLVGLGLDVRDFTVKALDALKTADMIYFEDYTNPVRPEVIDYVKSLLPGKNVERLERSDLEERALEKLIKPAASMNVAILVPGDPLSATTHASILLDARREGIECRIFHAPSILTAVAECGLQLYKFGRTVTLPSATTIECPKSVYDYMVQNRGMGLHTLVLLDVGMQVIPALRALIEADKRKIVDEIVVLSRIGTRAQNIVFGKMGDVLRRHDDADFGDPPHCIIIIGDLHFFEREFLEEVSKKR